MSFSRWWFKLKRCFFYCIITNSKMSILTVSFRCNHFAQERKDIFGSWDVVESFRFHPTLILLFLNQIDFYCKFVICLCCTALYTVFEFLIFIYMYLLLSYHLSDSNSRLYFELGCFKHSLIHSFCMFQFTTDCPSDILWIPSIQQTVSRWTDWKSDTKSAFTVGKWPWLRNLVT